jgi:CBS domain-containing protein
MHPLNNIDRLVYPEDFQDPTGKSPALSVCTDFKHIRPLIIDSHTRAIEVEELMRKAHVKLKIVVNKDKELIGVISTRELSTQNILKRVSQGERREEIRVTDLMKHRAQLSSLDISDLEHATVSDVIFTLKENGEQHCLVIDKKAHHIRGIISASDIARRLHIPLVIEKAPTFVDLFKATMV